MERRTALALAAAVAGTVLAAGAAFAVNVGILKPQDSAPISVLDARTLEPAAVDPTVVTVIVEDPPGSAPRVAPGAGAEVSPLDPAVSASAGSASSDNFSSSDEGAEPADDRGKDADDDD